MKLTHFNSQTMPKQAGGAKCITPAISFGKSGVISLNKACTELMQLSIDDKIAFAQDQEDPANWYLYKDEVNGFPMRSKDFDKTGSLTFNHNNFRLSFLGCFGIETDASHRFLLAGTPTKVGKQLYYGILVPFEPVNHK